MAGPYNITQVDVPGLLSVYQGAQDRRVNQMLMQRKLAAEDRALEQQAKLADIYSRFQVPGQTKGGDPTAPAGGLASAYAPPAPVASQMPTSDGIDRNMPVGSPLSPAVIPDAMQPASPTTPQPARQLPDAQTWMSANADVVKDLMTVDPETAFKMVGQLNTLDNAQLEKAGKVNGILATVGEHLSSLPDEASRRAELQRIAPDLVAQGIPPSKIDQADLSDKGLQWLVVHGMDIDHIIQREKDDRAFEETQRHNRATEANAAGGLAVRQGALSLARSRESRVAAKGSGGGGGGDVTGLSTADLIRMAGGQ